MPQFSIPEENFSSLEKKLTRIRNKCAKYGCEFSYHKLGEHIVEKKVSWNALDAQGNLVTHTAIVPINYIDIDVEGHAQVNGWQFVASLEHTDEGNIINNIGKLEVPSRYYHCEPYCEHCKTNRQRKDSFIVYAPETGEFKQVGRNCLKDFTGGMDAEAVAQFESAIKEAQEASKYTYCGQRSTYLKTREYAIYVAETIRLYGYAKTDATDSTASRASDFLWLDHGLIGWPFREAVQEAKDKAVQLGWGADNFEASTKLADAVLAWIAANPKDDNYFHNLKVACANEYLVRHSLGLVASAFPAYDRQLQWDAERREREAQQKAAAAASTWAGNVGDRVTFQLANFRTITSWETQWGTTYVYAMTDDKGITYTWKTSCFLSDRSIGKTVKGTVKELKEFRGVKQTELTRCKIA